MTNTKKSISAAQRKKDPHAGPHGSFPLDAEHVHAAWMLAGHAANPAAVRAKILAWAKRTGNMGRLPKTATAAQKAKSSQMQAILNEAYSQTEPHSYQRGRLLRLAADQNLLGPLTNDAHGDLHEYGIPHSHPDSKGVLYDDDGDETEPQRMHSHVVTKAFNPKATEGTIVKSWASEEDDQLIEGWMSTPRRDLEKDITEPEAFANGPLSDYFARSAPLSLEHGTEVLPAGHLQKGAILRDGKLIEQVSHPSDPAEFSHLPLSGSGVWVRGRVTEEPAKSAIRKGNLGGMSFIGNFTQYEPLPGGGKRFRRIDPLTESTVAAYPINPDAAFRRVQKAFGLEENETNEGDTATMDDDLDLIAMLDEAAARATAKQQAEESVQKGISAEQLGDLFKQFEARLTAAMDEKVQKAMIPERTEGTGRKGGPAEGPVLEDDPVNFLVQKAGRGEEFSVKERDLASKLFSAALAQGMTSDPDEE